VARLMTFELAYDIRQRGLAIPYREDITYESPVLEWIAKRQQELREEMDQLDRDLAARNNRPIS